jgi:hypothetical protein
MPPSGNLQCILCRKWLHPIIPTVEEMLQSFCQEEKLRPILSREEVTDYSAMKGSCTLFFLKKDDAACST